MITWKEVASLAGGAAPILGTLLGGPAGAAVGSMIASALGCANSPDAVNAALAADPDAAVKLKQIEADQSTALRGLTVTAEQNRLAAETSNMAAVNETMRSEDGSTHWPTYTWRPLIGLAVAFNTIIASLLTAGVYVGVMLGNPLAAAAVGTLPTVIGALGALSAVSLPILGIASYFRGKMQADPNVPSDNRG